MAPRIAQVLQELGCERALVVHGTDGLDELSIAEASVVYDVTPGRIERTMVTPEQLGLTRSPLSAIAGGDLACSAEILRAVLAGAVGAPRDVVVLNAAAGLLAAGRAESLLEGVELARLALDDGSALDQLERWIAAGAEVAA
jgi:anthranilate phosphoribosyltransferase